VSDTNSKRQAILALYPGGVGWKAKVNKMSDQQIVAMYLRLKGQGKVA
jgi:hypothetical protein